MFSSSPCSHEISPVPIRGWVILYHTLPSHFCNFHIIIILHCAHTLYEMYLPFPDFFPKRLRLFLVSPIRTTYPTHFMIHDLVIQVGLNPEVGILC